MGITATVEKPLNAAKLKEEVEVLRTAMKDIRYVLGQYGEKCPTEAFITIKKIVNDPKLK